MTEPLFGDLPAAEPPAPVRLHDKPIWTRLDRLSRPQCGHCVMLRHYGQAVEILAARWTRTGRNGSVLELCEPHRHEQEKRDQEEEQVYVLAANYITLANSIVETMDDPDDWDDGERDQAEQLAEYVTFVVAKIQDIETVLDRDMKE